MFGFILHSAQQKQKEGSVVRVVPGGRKLVVDELVFDVVVVSFLSLVVSEQDNGGVKSCNHYSHHKVNYSLPVNYGIMQGNEDQLYELEL